MIAHRSSLAISVLFALSTGVAGAVTCTPGSGAVTCTGGAGANVTVSNGNGTTVAGSPFPSTINVTGGSGTVNSVSVTINGYTSVFGGSGSDASSRDLGLLLVSPDGTNYELLRCVGTATIAQSNITFSLSDGNTQVPACGGTGAGSWTSGGSLSPSSNTSNLGLPSHPDYAQAGAPALQANHFGHNNGSATLNGVFAGHTINGNWSLYMVADSNNSQGTNITFASWDITLTFTAATTPTTTTLTPVTPNDPGHVEASAAYTSGVDSTITLTATVSGSGGTPTGTITFKDGNSNLTCSQGNPVAMSGGSATCTTTISAEGLRSLSAAYSGDSTFVTSTGTANVFTQNHATSSSNTYCNSGAVGGTGAALTPYPSVIFVGDGTVGSPSIPSGSVNTVSLTLKNFTASSSNSLHMLLVAPDRTHALDFWGEPGGGAASAGNYTVQDGASAFPNSPISPGTYAPTSTFNTDTFSNPSTPAPQPPASFSLAQPAGTATFQTSFVGAAANGAWTLFIVNDGSSVSSNAAGGWCVNISPATGHATTTTVQSSPTQATKGSAVTFTATVTSSPAVGNTGQVTFTENGLPLTGAPNGGVASVSNGVATVVTTGLPEGDHTITASYHDSTNTFNDSFGTVTMRVDAATATPTLSGNTWSYCNTAGITIPRGVNFVDDIGAAAPNPSNVFVTNLFGTVNSVTLTLKGFHVTSPGDLESLLVGPNGLSAPTSAQTLDFFSGAGGNGGSTSFSHDTTFTDSAGAVSCAAGGPAPGTTAGPTSCSTVSPSYTASPFYTLPGIFQRATNGGNFTFDTGTYSGSGGGVYSGTIPNGTWSVYFDQLIHHAGDGATSWCMNFIENNVTLSATKAHLGSAPSNHFVQGEQNAQFTFTIQNNGTGSTGDPDGNHPLQVVDTLDPAFSYASFTGSGWSCTAAAQVVTCVNHASVAQGSSYPGLTINVNVSNTATPGQVTNTGVISGGGATSTSPSDTVTIDPAPVLSVTKAHVGTFTQGQTGAEWDITVNNTKAASNTMGTTFISDTLPSSYVITSITASGWSCGSSVGTGTLSCTSTQVVAGGASFNTIQMFVTVPAASPTSVTNTASAWGGGDVVHTTSGTAVAGSDTVTVIQVPATITINGSATQSATVNTAFSSLAVTVKDAGGVAIPNYSSAVFTASTGGGGQTGTFAGPSSTATVTTNSSGIADPGAFTANTVTGSYTVDVAAGPATHATFTLTNTAGAATHFTLSAPSPATAGTGFNFTVTALDQFNNTATGYAGTVHFTSTDGQAVLPSNSTLTNGAGTFSATLKTAGNQTITGTDTVTASIAGTSNSITVNAGATTHYTVSAPGSAAAGTAFNFTVTALDAFNNTTTAYAGTVHFTSTDAQAVLPANSTLTNGTGTFSATLKTAGNQTITGTDTVTSSITGTSNSITVSAGAATHLSVVAPPAASAGTPFNLTVTAQDQFNNTATGYRGTVHFTSTDSGASVALPVDYQFTASDNGTHTFSAAAKLTTAGNQTITATDTTTPSITGTSNPIAVNPGVATHFAVSAPPTATAGTAFNFTITELDQYNNTVTTDNTSIVHFTSSDAQAVLPGNATLSSGAGTFSATLKTAGNQTITVTNTSNPSVTGTSNSITVSAGTTTHFTVSAPGSAAAGTAFNFTVTALDAFNNTTTGYAGSVHFTSTDGQAVLPANSTLTNGVGTFAATLKTAGNQTITATDTVTSSITGTSNSVTVSGGAGTHLGVSAPGSATAGTAFNFTVTALDQFNNTASGYTGTVHFSSTDGQAVLPVNYTFTVGDNGVHVFSATLKTAGSQTITATDTITSSITGTSNSITVTAGAATHYSVSAPLSATAGTAFNFTVTALDQFNNTATGYTGTVHFTSSDAQAVLPANSTLTNGTGTFPATLKTAGNQTITGTDTVTSSITGTSGTISVSAPDLQISKTHSPSSFIVNDQGDTFTITVTNTGNAASSGTVTVTDTLPSGLTFAGSTTAGWSCNAAGSNPVVCSTTNAIAATNGTSQVTISVNVASSTSSPLTNNVSVACTCPESNTGNNSNTDSVTVLQTVGITLATSPTGLQVSGDGGTTFFAAPHTFQWVPNSTHTIVTTSPQSGGVGTQYVWLNWSDAGAISHTINAGTTTATYTATFKTQYQLTTQVSPSATFGSISPSSGFVDANSMVSVTASPNVGYAFTGFTGALTGTTNPQTLTVTAPSTVTANFAALPDVAIGKTHPGGAGGHFSQGQLGATYTLSVSNNGPGVTSGTVTVTESIPTGLTLVSMAGTGWTCGAPNPNNVCTRTDSLGSGGSYQSITVTVNVDPAAPSSVTNSATVSATGDYNSSNNTAFDPTTVNKITDVSAQVSVTQSGFGRNRATGIWSATLTVTNNGGTINGPVQVVLTNLSSNATMTNATGTRNGSPYITVSAGALAPGASASVTISFTNPTNGFITYTPVTDSGVF